jgi:segregation and condensation protein B
MPASSVQSKLEALLFLSGEPVAESRLAELLGIGKDELRTVAAALTLQYAADQASGLMLISHQGKIEMATKKELGALVEAFTKSTLQDTLSKAALEVLSIIAYRSPIARSEIEAIRGVNCSYTLRALLIRGLVDRLGNPADARGYVYRPTFAFLESLGLSGIEELPEYATLSADERMGIVQDLQKSPSIPSENPS